MKNKYVSPAFEAVALQTENIMGLFNSAEGDDSKLRIVDFDLWSIIR